jgi:type IV secretory pathway ATPase VirB11/archaellum biosynthesis ATPase
LGYSEADPSLDVDGYDSACKIVIMANWLFGRRRPFYFWLAIENNKSLIFIGGTASGKTTSLNAVSLFIPPVAKVVSIEDTREITLYHENWIASVTRPALTEGGTAIDMFDLLRAAMRQRPEYKNAPGVDGLRLQCEHWGRLMSSPNRVDKGQL